MIEKLDPRALNGLIWAGLIVLVGLILVGAGWFISLLSPILTPLLLGAFFAYLGDPLADRLEALRFPRSAAVVTVFTVLTIGLLGIIILLIPSIEDQIDALSVKIPAYKGVVLNNWIPWVEAKTGVSMSMIDLEQIKEITGKGLGSAQGLLTKVLPSIFGSGLALFAFLGNMVLIPVVTFYLLRDWDVIVARVHVLIPRHFEPTIKRLTSDSDQVLGAFIRGQILVMFLLGVIYTIGLSLVGLELALLIGLVAGLVSFVPYLGLIVGIILAGLAALLQFGDAHHLLYVGIVFAVGQALEGLVLTPIMVGDKIGLHPVAVIFAVLAGGQLFGFIGVLIGLPVAAVLMVVLRFVCEKYMSSGLYSSGSGHAADAE